MNSFRTGEYLVYLLRPGQSFQAWHAYHQYLTGLRRSYARYGVEELAKVDSLPSMFVAGYRLEPSAGGRRQVLVGGMRVDVRDEPLEYGYQAGWSPYAWYQGGWSEDRAFTPVLARCLQHLLDELGLDEGYALAGDHALRIWEQGGAAAISEPIPGPLHYTSRLLQVRSQMLPADQWDAYASECRQLGGLGAA